MSRSRRRARRRSGWRVAGGRADPSAEQCQSACGRGRHDPFQHEPSRLPSAGAHAIRKQRVDELLTHWCTPSNKTTSRSPARARSTARPVRPTGGLGKATPERPNQRTDSQSLRQMGEDNVPAANRVFGAGHYLQTQFRAAVPLPKRARRRRHVHELAHVGAQSRALRKRHGPRRHRRQSRAEQRRLQSRIVPRRADRKLHVRHRRRLHRRSSPAATPTAAESACRAKTLWSAAAR